jgi:hypothetical protein
MRRRATILLSAIVFSALLLGYMGRVVVVHAFHDDACLVIAMLVADRIEKGEPLSDAELRIEIADLIRASVIHGRVGRDGSPTDLNGNPFVIEHTAERAAASTRFSLLQPIRSHAEVDIKSHNKSVETNRRPASPFNAGRQFESASCAPPFLPAAVAHLSR